MLKEDGVSNLIALSMAGVLFVGLLGAMVLQTVDQPDIEVPGSHERLADELYATPIIQPGVCDTMILNECWLSLGFQQDNGYLNLELWDAIVDGVASTHPHNWNASEAEVTGLAPGWVSFAPHSVFRNSTIGFVTDGVTCPIGVVHDYTHYPSRGTHIGGEIDPDPIENAGVYCLDPPTSNCPDPPGQGEPRCPSSFLDMDPEVLLVNAADLAGTSNFKFGHLSSWIDQATEGGNGKVAIFYSETVGPGSGSQFETYVNSAVDSYLGGLFDLTFPDTIAPQEGANGLSSFSESDVWEVEGALAATRLGALPVQLIFTTQNYDVPVIENLISREEGGFLSWGERGDFDAASRLMVHPDGFLVEMKTWSAPSTH